MLHYKSVMYAPKITSLSSPQKELTDHSLTNTELEGCKRFIRCEGCVNFSQISFVCKLKKKYFHSKFVDWTSVSNC
jgi:hypothetical protein